ncbi:regulator [Labilibacter sediminis]|nr:regulator [Labilibacter sediminis]
MYNLFYFWRKTYSFVLLKDKSARQFMKQYLSIIFILILIFTPVEIYSQNTKIGLPEVEHFNRRQYGAATQNWQISQSNYDLMYFANNGGLLEYDGKSWQVHKQMNASVVRSVQCIGDKIFVGAHNEFGYFEYDSLNRFNYTSLTPDSMELNGDYWCIHEWNNTIVFQGEKYLSVVKDDVLIEIVPAISRFVSSYVVNDVFYVQDESEGLMEFKNNKIEPVEGGHVFTDKKIATILSIDETKIVIGTMKNGLFVRDGHTFVEWMNSGSDLIKTSNLFCGSNYNDNFLVFGTIQNGVIITDLDGSVTTHINKDKGLKNNTVLSSFVDHEGIVWLGLDNGIAKIEMSSNVTLLDGYYNLGTGYVQDNFKGSWYFGTNQGLYTINDEDFLSPVKTKDDFIKIKGTEGQVWSMFKDDNTLLCGHNVGIFEIDNYKSNLITPPGISGIWIFRELEDDSNTLLAGSYKGLIVLKKENGKWKYRNRIKGFDESSRFMEWDEEGNLWVSHGYNLVYKLKLSEDLYSVNETDTYGVESFPGNSALIVTKLNNRCTVYGQGGIYQIGKNGAIEKYTLFDSFFKETALPKVFTEDEFHNIWFFHLGKVGVLRLLEDGTYKKIENPFISIKDKLVTSFEYVYTPDRENVFFGIEDGYAHYLVNDSKSYRSPFKVHIRSFKGQSDTCAIAINQLQENEDIYTVKPAYAFKNNSFDIEYAAPFFSEENIQYSTKLSGVDLMSSPWSRSTTRQFHNLKEGNYQFTVKARNSYGVESSPLSVNFQILPPWHRSTNAKIIYFVVCLILIIVGFAFFNKHIVLMQEKATQKQKKQFEATEEKLKSEALQKEKEVIKVRNEKLRNEMAFKEKELAGLTVHIIQKNDFLSELQDHLKRLKGSKANELERKINNLILKIGKDIDNESNWQMFEKHFEQVHQAFLDRLVGKFNNLTPKEKKLCAYIKMGMVSKEIASLMHISTRAVENNRYKLRQKLGLQSGDDLSEFISNI